MSNILEVGNIVEGKIINVKPYGAFVSIGENQKGLIHISHISNDFVKDINSFLKQGAQVKVKIISIENDKIALSLKDVPLEEQSIPAPAHTRKPSDSNPVIEVSHKSYDSSFQEEKEHAGTKSFDELLKDYNRQANDKIVAINKRLKR